MNGRTNKNGINDYPLFSWFYSKEYIFKMTKGRVAIIGGYGGMGRLFASLMDEYGFEVVIAGPTKEKGELASKELGLRYTQDNKEAVKGADIVIVTVPIEKTTGVIKEIASSLKDGAFITDFTSVKGPICELMENEIPKGVEVAGGHPVFGPSIRSFSGQNFILCPIREGARFNDFCDFLRLEGANVIMTSPQEHDHAMGTVQALTHFMLISAGVTMHDMKSDIDEVGEMASPIYRLTFDIIGRILGQDPALYAEIQLENPASKEVREAYIKAAGRLAGEIDSGDKDAFISEMKKAAEFFGDTKGALERTDLLLD